MYALSLQNLAGLALSPAPSPGLGTVPVQPKPYVPGEAFREQSHEQRAGQADDVQVVAPDPGDEVRSQALDRVRAGASLPLSRSEVRANVHVPRYAEGVGRGLRQLAAAIQGLGSEPGTPDGGRLLNVVGLPARCSCSCSRERFLG